MELSKSLKLFLDPGFAALACAHDFGPSNACSLLQDSRYDHKAAIEEIFIRQHQDVISEAILILSF